MQANTDAAAPDSEGVTGVGELLGGMATAAQAAITASIEAQHQARVVYSADQDTGCQDADQMYDSDSDVSNGEFFHEDQEEENGEEDEQGDEMTPVMSENDDEDEGEEIDMDIGDDSD